MKLVIKLVKGVFALLGFLLVLVILLPMLWHMLPASATDRSFCVVVADTRDFTGTYLLHRQAQSKSVIKTTECEAQDRQIDGGDGMRAGRVRWVVCPRGPDCDEAGRF